MFFFFWNHTNLLLQPCQCFARKLAIRPVWCTKRAGTASSLIRIKKYDVTKALSIVWQYSGSVEANCPVCHMWIPTCLAESAHMNARAWGWGNSEACCFLWMARCTWSTIFGSTARFVLKGSRQVTPRWRELWNTHGAEIPGDEVDGKCRARGDQHRQRLQQGPKRNLSLPWLKERPLARDLRFAKIASCFRGPWVFDALH